MARRNQEFHPDAQNRDVLGKLLLTQKQRKRLLKWLLFTAVCLLGLLVQFRCLGCTIDSRTYLQGSAYSC